MAKRRKASAKRRHHRRSKMSGINSGDFMDMALAIAGALGAKVITNNLSTSTNASLLQYGPYIPLAIGIALPLIVKNPMVGKIAIGMVAGGGLTALGSTGLKVISGFENSIGYPGRPNYNTARALVNGIGGPAGTQGLTPGTRSNFSGSRMSQINTIGAIHEACNCN